MDKIRDLGIVEEKVLQLRYNLNMTQKEFGKIIGISKSYLSDMENGYKSMSIHLINNVCNATDISFDFLFGFCEDINKNVIKVNKINLKILGSNLKQMRKELNCTQEKMANKLNISQSFLSLCEQGNKTIKTDDLKQLCEISGYSADYCVGKLKENIKRTPIKKIKTREIKELIQS